MKGKSIVFLTTNGTGAIVRSRYAGTLFIAAFTNLGAVVGALARTGGNFTVLCAGHDEEFSLEDAVCAGKILGRYASVTGVRLEINDSAAAAMSLDKTHGKALQKLLRETDHGRHLAAIGFGSDLKTCAALDSVPIVPLFQRNIIRKAP